MAERHHAVPRAGLRPMIGLAASVVAVWCQILLLASISLVPLAVGGDPLGGVPICHLADGRQPAPGAPAHRCVLCAICLAHALPSAILSPSPALPERNVTALVRAEAAQPRAPPLRLVSAAQPRGPPSLS